ncbi:hypothetical protein HK097_004144 [Rhizophlyctis rosea]|uniref:USP domain-containing protein n=1 Tax=Rhizophlyctis rosea TaxID=64517 RepID=A0AAD5SEB1_9FUNG|nr:hypothetical protein HK097_004144 [Rhizophlyctis rosea]
MTAAVTRKVSKRLVSPTSTAPEIVIYPPDSDEEEANTYFAPNEFLVGLQNITRSNLVSALNAFLQVLVALPELNEELPRSSTDEKVASFTKMARSLRCDLDKGTIVEAGRLRLEWWEEKCRQTIRNTPSSLSPELDDATVLTQHFEHVVTPIMDEILSKTRFGKRFDGRLTEVANGPNGTDGRFLGATEQKTTTISLSLGDVPPTGKISLIPLLNKRLGHSTSTFFFGGSLPPSLRNRPQQSPIPAPKLKFSKLPFYLTFTFKRTLSAGTPPSSPLFSPSLFSPTSQPPRPTQPSPAVELPMEMDLSYSLSDLARSTRTGKDRDRTFYRLHGFVTHSGGHFLCYTRVWGGSEWFRCDDERIGDVELGVRVESRGVVLAVYRLQD